MKKKLVVLAIVLVSFIAGFFAMPGYELAVQEYDRYQLLQKMETDPIYQMVDSIETAYPEFFVVYVDKDENSSMIWVYFNQTEQYLEKSNEERNQYFFEAMAGILVKLMANDAKQAYTVVFVAKAEVMTTEGLKTRIIGTIAYGFTAAGANEFTASPIGETLDALYETGEFNFLNLAWYGYPSPASILEREPGFEFPWE